MHWHLSVTLAGMSVVSIQPGKLMIAATPSLRTRHAELLRLCARIGYSPPFDL
jgi:hypothetical protein